MLSKDEACERLRLDRDRLLVAYHDSSTMVVPGPPSQGLQTVRDVVAHVAMWDEIVLAAITGHQLGRTHWSVDPRWAGDGAALNEGGIASGRLLPEPLVLQRFLDARDLLIDTLATTAWDSDFSAYCEDLNTPELPGTPYCHGTAHLKVTK